MPRLVRRWRSAWASPFPPEPPLRTSPSRPLPTALPAPPGSLRDAILDANANSASSDRILFQSGLTGTVNLAAGLPAITGPTAIIGPGAAEVAVDGNSNHRVLAFNPVFAGAPVSVSGLTLRDGYLIGASDGAGIFNEDGDLSITATVIQNSSTFDGRGGAIFNNSGSLTISATRFINNFAGISGGAIFGSGGTATISGSAFLANQAEEEGGGAIEVEGTALAVTSSVFRGNLANRDGGAIHSH